MLNDSIKNGALEKLLMFDKVTDLEIFFMHGLLASSG